MYSEYLIGNIFEFSKVDVRKLLELTVILYVCMILYVIAGNHTYDIQNSKANQMNVKEPALTVIDSEQMVEEVTEKAMETEPIIAESVVLQPEVVETAVDTPIVMESEVSKPSVIPITPENTEEVFPVESTLGNFSGFLCNEDGMIVDVVVEEIHIIDGILKLPFDTQCMGISSGALASLGGMVFEIYIPSNIALIEAGAFDGLENLVYTEVDPSNPVYTGSNGELLQKEIETEIRS